MHNHFTVNDCHIVQLKKIHNRAGNITVIENNTDIPFAIKRLYYLYDIPGGESRGAHAHKNLEQLLVAASGSFDVTLNDGQNSKTFSLNRPYIGLYLRPGMWRDIGNFSSGAICLVLASDFYNENDYVRNYQEFLKFKNL